MSTDQIDNFDDFFRGEMSPAEKASFQEQIDSDSELSKEFDFQSELVQGIQSFRKSQLKERLANVSVSGGVFPSQSMGLKLAGYIGVTSAVILGMFYIPWSKNEPQKLVLIPGPEIESQAEGIALLEITESENVEEKALIIAEPVTTDSEIRNNPVRTSNKINSEAFLPTSNEAMETSDFDPTPVEENLVKPLPGSAGEEQLEVGTYDAENDRLSYSYFDGKLALYGNFGNDTYHILEINKQGGKKLFLFHAGNYYDISLRQTPSPLEKIEDPQIIRELDIFQEEK